MPGAAAGAQELHASIAVENPKRGNPRDVLPVPHGSGGAIVEPVGARSVSPRRAMAVMIHIRLVPDGQAY